MRPTRAPRRAIIAGVIMSIVVAGCGSDESASDDGTATSAATAPPTTEARPATTATPATDAPTTDPPPTTGAGTTVAASGGADGLGIPGGAASVEFCQAFVTLDRSVG